MTKSTSNTNGPLPVGKTKPSSKPPPKKLLSQEFIVDSDDEPTTKSVNGSGMKSIPVPKAQSAKGKPAKKVSSAKKDIPARKDAAATRAAPVKKSGPAHKDTPAKNHAPATGSKAIKPSSQAELSDSSEKEASNGESPSPSKQSMANGTKEGSITVLGDKDEAETSSESSEKRDSDSGSEEPAAKTPPVGGVKVANEDADDDSSEEEEDSDSSSDESASQTQKVNGVKASKEKADTESSGEESDEGSESESGEGSERSSAKDNARPARNHIVQAPHPVRPFYPPPGFRPTKLSDTPTTIAALQSSIKAGHQIWYITAPKGVPLTAIENVALQQVLQSEPVLKHKDIDYSFKIEDGKGSSKLLIPNTEGYESSPIQVERTLHLQQMVNLPSLSAKQADPSRGADAAAPLRAATVKRKREQPEGLRMRFQPIGVVDDVAEEEAIPANRDTNVPRAVPQFRVPPSLPIPAVNGATKKRKHDETPEKRAERKAAKKAKKEAKSANKALFNG